MNLPTTLLRLRLVQLRRSISPAGVVVLLAALALVPFVVHRMVVHDPSQQPYVNGLLLLILLGWHQQRKDLHFVLKHIERPLSNIGSEYLLVALPVALGQLGTPAWYQALAVLAAIPVIVRIQPPVLARPRLRWIRSRIPAHLFEWKGGLQHAHPLPALLWLLSLAFCWLPILPLMLLWVLIALLVNTQADCEPRAMLLATSPDASTLLRRKLIGGMAIIALLIIPALIGATIFQPQLWWVHLFFLAGQLSVVGLAIMLKYRSYVPNEHLTGTEPLVTTAAVFSVMPGLFLLLLIMLLRERRVALQNLDTYFHGDPH
ncbi:MAG: hypothetical protein IPO90_14290 [Flavobacteriales bacterium]|nr:hypothetical protein [Flavobacteriales bacterium]